MKWWIGCSGFYYPEWKNIFYPAGLAQRNWFEYYCRLFNTLELNNTFYRFPRVKLLKSWYEKSPDDFCFSVKVPRLITHYKKFSDTGRLLADFYSTIREGLSHKLGPVLFQLPPQIIYKGEWLQRLIASVDNAFTNVAEFRNRSWWKPEIYEQLAGCGITFCSISYPHLPDELIINTDILYYRFHGKSQLYQSRYRKKTLEQIASLVGKEKKLSGAFFYFDNTAGGHAVMNALELKQITRS